MVTEYHSKYFAYELTCPGRQGVERLSQSLFDAAVDLTEQVFHDLMFDVRGL